MKITHINQIHRTDTSGTLTLSCRDDAGSDVQVIFQGQVATGLLTALMAMPAPKSGQPIAQNPIQPSALGTFQLSSGEKGLGIHFRNGYVIQIAIPDGSIADFRKIADQLEQMK
jgi:hypothetical protein